MERKNGRDEQPIKGLPDRYVSPQTQPQYLDGVGPEEEMLKPYVSPQTPFVFKYPRIKKENGHNKQLLKSADIAIESLSYLDGVGPEEEMLKPYVSPQTPFVFKYPRIKKENGHNKQLLKKADMERENRRKEQLLKEELSRSIFLKAQHVLFHDPEEIRGKYFGNIILCYAIPTRLIKFPEFTASNFTSNIKLFGANSIFAIEYNSWLDLKVGIRRRKVFQPRTTTLSINIGISPNELRTFSIQVDGPAPKVLRYFPSISMDKWHPYTPNIYPVEIADLQSFKEAVDYLYLRCSCPDCRVSTGETTPGLPIRDTDPLFGKFAFHTEKLTT